MLSRTNGGGWAGGGAWGIPGTVVYVRTKGGAAQTFDQGARGLQRPVMYRIPSCHNAAAAAVDCCTATTVTDGRLLYALCMPAV